MPNIFFHLTVLATSYYLIPLHKTPRVTPTPATPPNPYPYSGVTPTLGRGRGFGGVGVRVDPVYPKVTPVIH